MPIPLFDLSRQKKEQASLYESMKRAALEVLEHQEFILGREVEAFESEIVRRALQEPSSSSLNEEELSLVRKRAHAIGTSSGTDALLALLLAQDIGPGDAVITTPYTFFATAGCVHRVGAELLFCDIDPTTYLMDPEKLQKLLASLSPDAEGGLRTARGNRVKMIIPIHLFGVCCHMDAIMSLAWQYELMVIEDAAQVLGADYPSSDGPKKAGAIAPMSYFSFYPTKNLGAAGDAGLAVCQDAQLAQRVRLIRNHGMEERYYHKVVGGNFRLDALQAAILRARLPFLEKWNEKRRENAALYRAAFLQNGLLERIALPAEPWVQSGLKNHHLYHQYVIRILESAPSSSHAGLRERVIANFIKKKIGYAIYYPVPLHLQECFAYLGYMQGDFPHAESAAQETLALPIFPELHPEEIQEVVATIAQAMD